MLHLVGCCCCSADIDADTTVKGPGFTVVVATYGNCYVDVPFVVYLVAA